jgi:hypothetical protein
MSMPTRRICSGCCAVAASGHALLKPIPTMNSRRRMACPGLRVPQFKLRRGRSNQEIATGGMGFSWHLAQQQFRGLYVSLGSKADVTPLNFDVCFTPESGHSTTPSRFRKRAIRRHMQCSSFRVIRSPRRRQTKASVGRSSAACEGWRQADDARLWYRHTRICCVRGCERGGLRSTGNRVVLCIF